MILVRERAGPYIRALRSALHALAPDRDHVPLAAALHHLAALDPALSGTVIAPAEVEVGTGMPSFTWMERVVAEGAVRREAMADEQRLRRAEALDGVLGARLRARAALREHIEDGELLPVSRLQARLRRVEGRRDWSLAYDRIAPDGRWVRVRVTLNDVGSGGPLDVDRRGRALVDPGLQHTLARHFATSVVALREVIADAAGGRAERVSRGILGPFWFPGIAIPEGLPPHLGTGLLLHASTEVIGADVHAGRHLDPWISAPANESIPDGYGVFRERRFAASGAAFEAARAWSAASGFQNVVVPVGKAPRKRL